MSIRPVSCFYELPDEPRHVGFTSIHPVVALTQDICPDIEQRFEALPVIAGVGKKAGIERAVNIVGEKNFKAVRFGKIHNRTRRVPGGVDGLDLPAAEKDVLTRPGKFSVRPKRL